MIGKNVRAAVIALLWIIGAAFVALLAWALAQGCVPKVASPETNTSQESSASAGDNSTVTSVTVALTEYGPQGAIGGLLLLLGRFYGYRQQRVTNKALERVMATIETNRWLGTPVDAVVTSLRRFDDPIEAKIHATAAKFGPSPADPEPALRPQTVSVPCKLGETRRRPDWGYEGDDAEIDATGNPRPQGATNQEAGK